MDNNAFIGVPVGENFRGFTYWVQNIVSNPTDRQQLFEQYKDQSRYAPRQWTPGPPAMVYLSVASMRGVQPMPPLYNPNPNIATSATHQAPIPASAPANTGFPARIPLFRPNAQQPTHIYPTRELFVVPPKASAKISIKAPAPTLPPNHAEPTAKVADKGKGNEEDARPKQQPQTLVPIAMTTLAPPSKPAETAAEGADKGKGKEVAAQPNKQPQYPATIFFDGPNDNPEKESRLPAGSLTPGVIKQFLTPIDSAPAPAKTSLATHGSQYVPGSQRPAHTGTVSAAPVLSAFDEKDEQSGERLPRPQSPPATDVEASGIPAASLGDEDVLESSKLAEGAVDHPFELLDDVPDIRTLETELADNAGSNESNKSSDANLGANPGSSENRDTPHRESPATASFSESDDTSDAGDSPDVSLNGTYASQFVEDEHLARLDHDIEVRAAGYCSICWYGWHSEGSRAWRVSDQLNSLIYTYASDDDASDDDASDDDTRDDDARNGDARDDDARDDDARDGDARDGDASDGDAGDDDARDDDAMDEDVRDEDARDDQSAYASDIGSACLVPGSTPCTCVSPRPGFDPVVGSRSPRKATADVGDDTASNDDASGENFFGVGVSVPVIEAPGKYFKFSETQDQERPAAQTTTRFKGDAAGRVDQETNDVNDAIADYVAGCHDHWEDDEEANATNTERTIDTRHTSRHHILISQELREYNQQRRKNRYITIKQRRNWVLLQRAAGSIPSRLRRARRRLSISV